MVNRLHIPSDVEILYKHLNKETNYVVMRLLDDPNISPKYKDALQLGWIQSEDHFVYHPKAQKCIKDLKRLYYKYCPVDNNQISVDNYFSKIGLKVPNFASDIVTMSIVGYSGAGKTALLKEFWRIMDVELKQLQIEAEELDNQFMRYPMVHTVLRNTSSGLKGLHYSLLSPFLDGSIINAQFRSWNGKKAKIRVIDIQSQLLYFVKATRVGLYLIDEFQHAGRGAYVKSVIDDLKTILLDSQIPYIPVGTPETLQVLALDDQLAQRAPLPKHGFIDYLSYSQGFLKFLEDFENFLPFREPSELASEDKASLIFDKICYDADLYKDQAPYKADKTNLRQITGFLRKVAENAFYKKMDSISFDLIEQTEWTNQLYDRLKDQQNQNEKSLGKL